MKFISTIDQHRGNDMPLPDYYRILRVKLSQAVTNKKIVYLDTKFWVLFRDASLFPDKNPTVTELLKLSVFLADRDLCIFPISEDVFLEVLRQTDPRTLKATVRLIDKLSSGVTLLSHEERTKTEIYHFWLKATQKPVFDLKELVWTKLAYNMGFVSPSNTMFKDDEPVIQKAFLDHMWQISLLDMVEILLSANGFQKPPPLDYSMQLNKGKFENQGEAKSFKQMKLIEVIGIVDCYRKDLAEMIAYMYERESGERTLPTKTQKEESMRLMGNMVCNLFRLDKVGSSLPAINISAGLHAAVRWDKQQKFQANDLHDFRHASAALPYCDYFFTEKRLTHLITQNLLSFDKLYGCEVCSKAGDALESLKSICSSYKLTGSESVN